jgi:hypothetical protein
VDRIIDYAWSRPSMAWLKKNGVKEVGRYIGQDTTGKNMTLSEVEELNKNDISVFTIFEYGAAQSTGGTRQGGIDGRLAKSMAADLGQPSGTPIYFSVDFDIPDYSPSSDEQSESGARAKLGPVGDYFESLQQYFPTAAIGGYGDYWLCQRLYTAKLATWFMQTIAWSGGQKADHLDLLQTATMLDGIADLDEYEPIDPIHKGIGAWQTTDLVKPKARAFIRLRTGSNHYSFWMTEGEAVHLNKTDYDLTLEAVRS